MKDSRDPAAGDDSNAVTGLAKLLQLGGDHDYCYAVLAVEFLEGVENQRLGADINSAGRFRYKEHLWLQREGLGKADLLLIAA